MSKFTFINEESSYVGNCKTTTEFSAAHIDDILRRFEIFLKGAGFTFNGHLNISEKQSNNLDNINLSLQDEYRHSISNDIELNIHTYGAAQPLIEFPTSDGNSSTLNLNVKDAN